jgi:hypothetical protein
MCQSEHFLQFNFFLCSVVLTKEAMKSVTPDVMSLTEHPPGYYFPSAFEGNQIKLVRDRSSEVAKPS